MKAADILSCVCSCKLEIPVCFGVVAILENRVLSVVDLQRLFVHIANQFSGKNPICGEINVKCVWPVNFIQPFVISLHLHNVCMDYKDQDLQKYRIMIEVVFAFDRFCSRTMWRLTLSRAARVKPLQGLTPSLQVAGEGSIFSYNKLVLYTIFEFTPFNVLKLICIRNTQIFHCFLNQRN